MKLITYRRADQAFQLAFVATVLSLVLEIVLSILLGLINSSVFGSGGENLLLQNTNGVWNMPLITALIITAIFFLITSLAPLAFPKAEGLTAARGAIYTLSGLTLLYLITTYLLIPTLHGDIPALQTGYWPISLGLATSIAFILTAQPGIAEREPKPRRKKKPANPVDKTPEHPIL